MDTRSALFAMVLSPALIAAQRGLVATDFAGRIAVFESSARLAGEEPDSRERILELTDAGVSVTIASPSAQVGRGVAFPRTDDSGQLRAYSTAIYPRGPFGPMPPRYTGYVKHAGDGWEVSVPGLAGLSRNGRWAVFSDRYPSKTTWVDLWTGARSELPGIALEVESVADDGALVRAGQKSLTVYRPGLSSREVPISFPPSLTAMIDRSGRYAAVFSIIGELWRVDLESGETELWLKRLGNCELLDFAGNGKMLLYREWSWLVLIREPGSGPVRISAEGLVVDSGSLSGDLRSVIATTADGITRFDLETMEAETVLPGPVALTRQPAAIAPGMWVKQEGRGLAEAEIRLNGVSITPLERSSSAIFWIVPVDAPMGRAELEIGQPDSPFQADLRTIEVQSAAPAFVTQADAGIGNSATLDWPVIRHADSGLPVLGLDPARPGEAITVLMTGLNGQEARIEWTLTLRNTKPLYRLHFESAEPHPGNAHWTVVRLRMPDLLPFGISVLGAGFGKVQDNALINTSDR